jgi:outer membrane receptor protein involved in Fe transport
VFVLGLPPDFITQIPLAGTYDAHTFFNELRLVSKSGNRWTWAVGVDYKDATYDVDSTTTTAPGSLPFDLLSGITTQDNKVWTAWAEAGFNITDKLLAGVGVRYFNDDTDYATSTISFGVPSEIAGQDTFTSTNPRFNLTYKVNDDWNLYVNAAKGFRSGGFNAVIDLADPTYSQSYKPESLWSYEVGSKSLLLDKRLDLEAAVYYNDWKDVQSNHYTSLGLTVTSNGGKIQGYGVDLSATVRVTDDFSLGATYGWNNMEYKEVPVNGDKAVGDPPDLAVQLSWSAFIDYHHALNAGSTLYGRADFQHSGDAQATLRSPVFTSITKFPERDLLNLRLGMTFGRYDVSLYANNALDEDKPIVYAPFGVLAEDVASTPRQYGLTLRASF